MPRRANPRELLVTESDSMKLVAGAVEQAAAHDEPVLVLGERGSGRELVARLIHLASRRRGRELVTVRPGAAPRPIFVDEIEGSSNSAFLRANGGSLLIKDVCDLTRAAQRKLSRLLRATRAGAPPASGPAAPMQGRPAQGAGRTEHRPGQGTSPAEARPAPGSGRSEGRPAAQGDGAEDWPAQGDGRVEDWPAQEDGWTEDWPAPGARPTERRPARRAGGAGSGALDATASATVPLYNVRVLAASDPGLDRAAAAEVFNRVLYERLSSCVIQVPPLRERAPDIPPLATQFIRQYAGEIGRTKMTLSTRAYDRLVAYPWPGNVAELKDIARRLVVNVRGNHIEAGDVDAALPLLGERVPFEQMSLEEIVRCKLAAFLRRFDGYPVGGVHEDVLARVERPLLDLVMEHTGGNQVKAAEILGLNRNTLRRKLSEHGLTGSRGGRGTSPAGSPGRARGAAASAESKKSRGAL